MVYNDPTMREFDTSSHSLADIHAALTGRPEEEAQNVEAAVRAILTDVRARGDEAVAGYSRRFDWPESAPDQLAVPAADLKAAHSAAPADILGVLRRSAENIRAFHEAEKERIQSWFMPEKTGRSLGQIVQPVEKAGVYVPGGKAAYPSTVLMACIPAITAEVGEIVLCTPPDRDGRIAELVAAAAHELGIRRVFRIGGAQAVGAMAYGTKSVPKVDIIAGPGNQYVNIAKRQVYGSVGIDMLAGPSEVAIIADHSAKPAFVAADILAQTEHGPENRAALFSPSSELINGVKGEIDQQRERAPRKAILEQSARNILLVKTRDLDQAAELSNLLAPEHLELQVENPRALLPRIRNAGAVLLGHYTGAPIGDYLAGPSHTLPTAGAARFSSPLSVATFLKRTSVIQYSPVAAREAAEDVALFAQAEGFAAHAAAARMRAG